MTMSNDDIFTPPPVRARERPFRTRHGAWAVRGPVIDQEGREIPDAGLRAQFEGLRFDFGHSSANPFGDLHARAAAGAARCPRQIARCRLHRARHQIPLRHRRADRPDPRGRRHHHDGDFAVAWCARRARSARPGTSRRGCSANVAVDGVVGLVPVAGDAFDVMFRANVRNVRMLKRWLDKQPRLTHATLRKIAPKTRAPRR